MEWVNIFKHSFEIFYIISHAYKSISHTYVLPKNTRICQMQTIPSLNQNLITEDKYKSDGAIGYERNILFQLRCNLPTSQLETTTLILNKTFDLNCRSYRVHAMNCTMCECIYLSTISQHTQCTHTHTHAHIHWLSFCFILFYFILYYFIPF